MILPPDVHVAFYRIAQESLNNALKHSQATHLILSLHTTPKEALLRIEDNGIGFDMQQFSSGMGLSNMEHRAAQAGATLTIISAPRQGTTITLKWQGSQDD